MISILSIILFLLLTIIGKSRGFKTFIIFYVSLFLIMVYLFVMSIGFGAISNAIIICIIVSIVTLFGLNGYNVKTKSSFISILVVLLFIFLLTYFIGINANIQGFSSESLEAIGGYSFDINYNMTDLFIGMYLVCVIGTIIDTSISVSSAMNEVYVNNKHLDKHELYKSGMNVGKDILATTINTLFFAVVAEFIGFFMWHYGATISYLINYKSFSQEIIKLLLCFIASILIIPITSYITSRLLIKEYNSK